MKLCRLIYRSISTEEVMENEELLRLEKQAVTYNSSVGITGLLLLSGNQFLQTLEGPYTEVNTLYNKISADKRHHTPELLTFEMEVEPYFSDWNMRLVDLYDLPKEKRQFLMAKYANKDGIIEFPDRLHEIYSLMLDAKTLCAGEPWRIDNG